MTITNSTQRATLTRIFKKPTPNDIPWNDIKSLLLYVGCNVKYGKGSRVSFQKENELLAVHSPHPQRQTPSETVKVVKDFLESIGEKP